MLIIARAIFYHFPAVREAGFLLTSRQASTPIIGGDAQKTASLLASSRYRCPPSWHARSAADEHHRRPHRLLTKADKTPARTRDANEAAEAGASRRDKKRRDDIDDKSATGRCHAASSFKRSHDAENIFMLMH